MNAVSLLLVLLAPPQNAAPPPVTFTEPPSTLAVRMDRVESKLDDLAAKIDRLTHVAPATGVVRTASTVTTRAVSVPSSNSYTYVRVPGVTHTNPTVRSGSVTVSSTTRTTRVTDAGPTRSSGIAVSVTGGTATNARVVVTSGNTRGPVRRLFGGT